MFKIILQQIDLISLIVQKSFMKEGAGKVEVKDSKEAIAKALELAKSYENDRTFREKISQDAKLKKDYENALKTLVQNVKDPSLVQQSDLIKSYLKDSNTVLNSKEAFSRFQTAKLDLIQSFSDSGNDKPKEKVTLKEVSHELKVKSIDEVRNNFDLATSKITKKIEDGKTLTSEESKKLKEAISLAEAQITEIEKTTSQKDKAYNDIKKDASDLKVDLVNAKKAAGEYTQESTNMEDNDFEGTFISGKENRSEYVKNLNASSKASLDKILQSKDFLKITLELVKEINSEKYLDKNKHIDLGPFNYGKLVDMLESHGYKFSDIVKSQEIMAVVHTLNDFANTQVSIPNLSSKEKMKLLLDFDNNGQLTKDLNFSVGELQGSNLLTDDQKINNILENLGLGNMQTFSKSMQENLALSKERFKTQLGSMIESKVALSELSVKGGVNKAFNDIYKEDLDLSKDISSEIDNSKELELKLEGKSLSEEQKHEFKKILKLEAIGGVVGSKTGAGATFDIKDYTKNIIDSVGFGMVGGTPGITFTKKVYDKNGVNASVGLANAVVPMASLSYTLERNPELKKLFDKQIDDKYQPTIYAGVTTLGSAIGFNVEKVSENTKTGVDRMVSEMHTKLLTIKGDLLNGNSFENSKYAKTSTDKVADEIVYNDMLNSFRPLIGTNVSEKALNSMLIGYEEHYKNYLFQNAEGLHITSAGAGVALVTGFLPTPYLTLGGELNSTEFKTINSRLNSQLETTKEAISPLKAGISFETIDGKNVYSIVDNGNIEFSSPTGVVETKRENGKIYFSGDIKSIEVSDYLGQTGKTRSVLLNGGNISKNGEVKYSKETPIVSSVKNDILHTSTVENHDLNELNTDILEKSKLARNDLFNIIDDTAVMSKNTPGLQKLQRAIFKLSTHENSGNLEQVWSSFKDLVNNPKFDLYAKSTNSTQSLAELRQIIPSIENNSEVKMIILKSLTQSLMKKGSLKINSGEVEVGKSIREHDKRDKFFSEVIGKNTPELLKSVNTARTEWFTQNGNKTNYKFIESSSIDLESSIAFSVTETRLGDKGLIPFTGAYHIADAGVPEIEISAKSPDLIRLVPESYVNLIRQNLENNNNLKLSNKEVRDLLNGKEVNGNKMDYKLSYVKMGECLNDAMVLKALTINSKKILVNNIESSTQTSANIQENNSVKFGLVGAGEKHEKNHDNNKTTLSTNPGEEQQGPDATPQAPTTTPIVQEPTVVQNGPTGSTTGVTTQGEF